MNIEMKKTLLEEDIQELKGTNKLLDSQIEYEKKELEREKEKVLEVKNQRISMGEITQTTKERLFRNMKKILKIFLAYVGLIGALGLLLTGLVISMIVLGVRAFEGWFGFIIEILVIFPFLTLFSLVFDLFECLIDSY